LGGKSSIGLVLGSQISGKQKEKRRSNLRHMNHYGGEDISQKTIRRGVFPAGKKRWVKRGTVGQSAADKGKTVRKRGVYAFRGGG